MKGKIKKGAYIAISYEFLAVILGLEVGSVKFLEVRNNPGTIYIYHDDEKFGARPLAENEEYPGGGISTSDLTEAWTKILERAKNLEEEK